MRKVLTVRHAQRNWHVYPFTDSTCLVYC